ncbi:MAG: thiol peroxidase [Schleiferiaceae bacterium]|jgi:thiol peroxidase|nr:thiol peroxidase [Schleiferiaceae bacterium]
MATITLGGKPFQTNGEIPQPGDALKSFELVTDSLTRKSLSDYTGKRLVLNIFPSVDTGVCAASIRKFNQESASLENTTVLCISRDLPFAQKRFCGAEGIENVEMLSDFETGDFSKDYGLYAMDGGFKGLSARVVIVTDENHKVIYSEQVPEIGQEPDYESALKALK